MAQLAAGVTLCPERMQWTVMRTNPEGRFLIVSNMRPDEIAGWNGEPVVSYEQIDVIAERIISRHNTMLYE